MEILSLPNDCLRCIMELLPLKDWLSFNKVNSHLYSLSTPTERQLYAHANRGELYCAARGSIDGNKLIIRKSPIPKNLTDGAIVAAAYNQLGLMKWLVENRREIIQALTWIAGAAVIHESEETLRYLALHCDLKRKYCYYGQIDYEKVHFNGIGSLRLLDALNGDYVLGEENKRLYNRRKIAHRIVEVMMEQLGIERS